MRVPENAWVHGREWKDRGTQSNWQNKTETSEETLGNDDLDKFVGKSAIE